MLLPVGDNGDSAYVLSGMRAVLATVVKARTGTKILTEFPVMLQTACGGRAPSVACCVPCQAPQAPAGHQHAQQTEISHTAAPELSLWSRLHGTDVRGPVQPPDLLAVRQRQCPRICRALRSPAPDLHGPHPLVQRAAGRFGRL